MNNIPHRLFRSFSLPTWVCAGLLALSGIAHAAPAPQPAPASQRQVETIATATPVTRGQSQSVDTVASALQGRLNQMVMPVSTNGRR